jgi:hypothetical protein
MRKAAAGFACVTERRHFHHCEAETTGDVFGDLRHTPFIPTLDPGQRLAYYRHMGARVLRFVLKVSHFHKHRIPTTTEHA